MSGITDPTEQYFKDGLWGWDGVRWQKLSVDADGNLRVTMNSPHVARCSTAAGQSIPNSIVTIVNFGTVIEDTHSQITTGAAWKFTCKQAGLYLVTVRILYTSTTNWANGEGAELAYYLNNAEHTYIDRKDNYNTSSPFLQLGGLFLARMALTDYLDIRTAQSTGASLALYNSAQHNSIEIAYICA